MAHGESGSDVPVFVTISRGRRRPDIGLHFRMLVTSTAVSRCVMRHLSTNLQPMFQAISAASVLADVGQHWQTPGVRE